MSRPLAHLACAVALMAPASVAESQDTLRLSRLQEAALRTDPRAEKFDLLEWETGLRLSILGSERLPRLTVNAWASHQSDVTRPSLGIPGASFPDLPHDRWESTLDVQQLLFDGGNLARRRELERTRHAESAAGVHVALYSLRSEVNAAFFAAFLLQQQSAEYDALISDLDVRLAAVRARVEAGTALGRDAAEVEAERLQAMLQRDAARATRRASLAILADLVHQPIDTMAILALPLEQPEKDEALTAASMARLRLRPEFDRFRQARVRLEHETAVAATENSPRISAFGQAGVGLPGLDQFRTSSDAFWRAGLKVEWRPWTWRSAGRSVEALRLEERMVERDEQALAGSLARQAAAQREEIARLAAALAEDQRIVALRVEIERQARAQHDEGAITTADYVEARTNVLEARLDLQRHLVELAQARATYQTTLGLAPGAGVHSQ